MPNFAKGRGVTVRVANVMTAAKTVTAVTKANPGVASSAAHGLVNGAVGYFNNVTGMVQLEGQAAIVANQATGTFELRGLNTTSYSDFSGSCQFVPVSTWHVLSEVDQYSVGGGEASELDTTCLVDVIARNENGLLAAQNVTLNVKSYTAPSAGMQAIIDAAKAGVSLVFDITLADGAKRVFYGEPSMPGESLGVNALGTGSLTVRVKGFVVAA
jgi:hypothetical protein